MTIPRSETTTTRRQPEPVFELVDLGGQRLVVVQLAGEHLDRDRPARLVAQQPVDDLRRAALAVARVAQRRQRAAASLEVGGGDVVEHQLAVVEMPAARRSSIRAWRSSSQSIAAYRSSSSASATPSSSASVDWPNARTVASFDAGAIARWQIIANARSRSRDGARSSSRASSSRPPSPAPRSRARPAASARSRTRRQHPDRLPRNPARTSSTSSSGRCEMFPTVSFLTLPPSR